MTCTTNHLISRQGWWNRTVKHTISYPYPKLIRQRLIMDASFCRSLSEDIKILREFSLLKGSSKPMPSLTCILCSSSSLLYKARVLLSILFWTPTFRDEPVFTTPTSPFFMGASISRWTRSTTQITPCPEVYELNVRCPCWSPQLYHVRSQAVIESVSWDSRSSQESCEWSWDQSYGGWSAGRSGVSLAWVLLDTCGGASLLAASELWAILQADFAQHNQYQRPTCQLVFGAI